MQSNDVSGHATHFCDTKLSCASWGVLINNKKWPWWICWKWTTIYKALVIVRWCEHRRPFSFDTEKCAVFDFSLMLQLDVVLLPLLVPVRAFSHRVLFVCCSSVVLNSNSQRATPTRLEIF